MIDTEAGKNFLGGVIRLNLQAIGLLAVVLGGVVITGIVLMKWL
jgi:hypothetical protein